MNKMNKNEVFFSKCDQILIFMWIWSHLLKKSLMENFFMCSKCLLRTLVIDAFQKDMKLLDLDPVFFPVDKKDE